MKVKKVSDGDRVWSEMFQLRKERKEIETVVHESSWMRFDTCDLSVTSTIHASIHLHEQNGLAMKYHNRKRRQGGS